MRSYSIILCSLLVLLTDNVIAEENRNIELLAASCAACHGTRGHSEGGLPSLAGMERLYIIEQMTQFTNGTRPATVMHHHASGYSAEEVELLANFFTKQ
jgi:sulfide dehydrogenase cytochrome subunit